SRLAVLVSTSPVYRLAPPPPPPRPHAPPHFAERAAADALQQLIAVGQRYDAARLAGRRCWPHRFFRRQGPGRARARRQSTGKKLIDLLSQRRELFGKAALIDF